jgi:carboxyl-terminal processing protease
LVFIYYVFRMKLKNKFTRSRLVLTVVIIAVLSLGFISLGDKEFDILKNLQIFHSLFQEVDRFYVDETSPQKLIESAIDGMLSSLDPYTTYIPEEDKEDFTFMTTGEYGGIGAFIRKAGNYAMISEPYENFPAQISGLRAGDTIFSIDNISTKGKDISDVSELLKGTPNTSLKLKIKRIGNKDVIEKTVTRQKITISNVPYFGVVADHIGYIRLSGFTKDAGIETKDALLKLKAMGVSSVILDLRGNPGGLLQEAVFVSNIFIQKDQEIVSTKGKVTQWDNIYKTAEDPVDKDIPLVVLVNRSSASASEIVAGALQDLDRAVIVGQRTFGKGLVQTTRPLSYDSQLKITTAKYYIPSGRCIQAVDYSHRNEDGSVGYIPDSLIKEFATSNGRRVFDGGGITPDVKLEPVQFSNITMSLFTKNLIFDYATVFAAKHGSYNALDELKPTEVGYQDFLKFLEGKSFDYTTQSDDKLTELMKVAKQEKYFNLAQPEFDALKTKLSHDKNKDLQTFSSEINSLLFEEIASRYFFQKGRIKASLEDDQELNKAIEVLNNPQQYTRMLQKSFTEANVKKSMQSEEDISN